MNDSNQSRSGMSVKSLSSTDTDVVVLGAGPYGLSAGVYLKSKNVHVRVFGEPMDFWANKIPNGMLLRSPREASHIADPESAFTLDAYEAASSTKPAALPVRSLPPKSWLPISRGIDKLLSNARP
jgi:cation diffusion facilitator CzcD-associated flavoprotein CzcO